MGFDLVSLLMILDIWSYWWDMVNWSLMKHTRSSDGDGGWFRGFTNDLGLFGHTDGIWPLMKHTRSSDGGWGWFSGFSNDFGFFGHTDGIWPLMKHTRNSHGDGGWFSRLSNDFGFFSHTDGIWPLMKHTRSSDGAMDSVGLVMILDSLVILMGYGH